MYELKFSLETLSPVVITAMSNSTVMTKSHDEISGSIIRGLLASLYVEGKKLGNKAHEDKNFRELFYGGLKFLSATLIINDKRSFILPLSLQRGKKGTDDYKFAKDLFTENPVGYKTLKGYGIVDGKKVFTASVKKNIFMHMSRSGESERISGKSKEGHIYNYEALEAGQKFCGAIIGNADDLKKLDAVLKLQGKNFVARIGRSRFTQYGKCRLTFDAIKEIETPKFAEKIYLRLDSALVPTDDYFIGAEKILKAEVADVLNKACGNEIFSIGKVFSSGVEIENFVVPWGMKRPRVQALSAGSVFELTAENLTPADLKILHEKIYCGFGTRTEEGFGQLRIWQPQSFNVAKPDKDKIEEPQKLSRDTIDLAQKILKLKLLEQVRIYANEDVNALKPQLQRGNYTHFFSRLDNIISNVGKINVREKFKTQLELELNASKSKDNIHGSTQFQDNLKKIYMTNDHSLFDVLTCEANLPYEDKDLKKDFAGNDAKLTSLFEKISFDEKNFADDICFEYLQNYFRYARKTAASVKGDGASD